MRCMMKSVRAIFGVALAATLLLGTASRSQAQNRDLKPTFGAVTLKAGFLPDPFTKNLIAGGAIETKLGGVRAKVANAPDFKLYYTAGGFPLTFRVDSKADTTLLINLPDGTWVANDDADGTLNPRITISNPQSGRYDIWVGTFGGGTPPAQLIITERVGGKAVVPPPPVFGVPNPNLKPTFGGVTLRAGFLPDPVTKDLIAGGELEIKLGGVKAKVATAPDYQLNYTAGNFALTLRALSASDTTLLVRLPNGTYVADDDSGGNFNPKITFARPQSGRYDIWVGTYGGGLPKAKLIITERESVVAPPGKSEADKVHLVLLIAGADSAIGKADIKDVASVKNAMLTAFAGDRGRLVIHDFTGKNPNTRKYYTGEEVLAGLRAMNIGRNDSVFVYHSGHGGIENPRDPEGSHVLTIDGGRIRRKAILDTVQTRQPRLVMILTDCCSNFTSFENEDEGDGCQPGNALNVQTVRNLTLHGVGVASITAAQDGKSGIASYVGPNPGNAGSAFTVALMREWYSQRTYTTWGEMFPYLRDETGRASGGKHYARAFQLPIR